MFYAKGLLNFSDFCDLMIFQPFIIVYLFIQEENEEKFTEICSLDELSSV